MGVVLVLLNHPCSSSHQFRAHTPGRKIVQEQEARVFKRQCHREKVIRSGECSIRIAYKMSFEACRFCSLPCECKQHVPPSALLSCFASCHGWTYICMCTLCLCACMKNGYGCISSEWYSSPVLYRGYIICMDRASAIMCCMGPAISLF